jgi:hypothetical protein
MTWLRHRGAVDEHEDGGAEGPGDAEKADAVHASADDWLLYPMTVATLRTGR